MAELSTIARPYAHALLLALREGKKGPEEAADLAAVLDGIAQVVTTPELVSVIGDPKLSSEQIYDLIIAGLGQVKLPEEAVVAWKPCRKSHVNSANLKINPKALLTPTLKPRCR